LQGSYDILSPEGGAGYSGQDLAFNQSSLGALFNLGIRY
jgi:hypothetical protein